MEQKNVIRAQEWSKLRWICPSCTSINQITARRCIGCHSWLPDESELRIGANAVRITALSSPEQKAVENGRERDRDRVKQLDHWMTLLQKPHHTRKTVESQTQGQERDVDKSVALFMIDPEAPWPWSDEKDGEKQAKGDQVAEQAEQAKTERIHGRSIHSISMPVFRLQTAGIGWTKGQMWGALHSTQESNSGDYSEWLARAVCRGWGTSEQEAKGAARTNGPDEKTEPTSSMTLNKSDVDKLNSVQCTLPDVNKLNNVECPLCGEPGRLVGLACQHRYCTGCWQGWCQGFSDPSRAHCMAMKCKAPLPLPFYLAAIGYQKRQKASSVVAQSKRDLYQNAVLLSFVRSFGERFRTCSTPGCEGFWDLEGGFDHVACAECFRVFCIQCKQLEHCGVDCRTVKDWWEVALLTEDNRKGTHESLSQLWMKSFARNCPKCEAPIQKMEGCNHMSCKACKYEFCWKCGERWSTHRICKAINKDTKEDEQKKSRVSLDKIQKVSRLVAEHASILRAIDRYRTNLGQGRIVTAWKKYLLATIERIEHTVISLRLRVMVDKEANVRLPLFQHNADQMIQWWGERVCKTDDPCSDVHELHTRMSQWAEVADRYIRALGMNGVPPPAIEVQVEFDEHLHQWRSRVQGWYIFVSNKNTVPLKYKKMLVRRSFYFVAGVLSIGCMLNFLQTRVRIRPEFLDKYRGDPLNWKHCFLPFLHQARFEQSDLEESDVSEDEAALRAENPRYYLRKLHKPTVLRRKGSYLVTLENVQQTAEYELVVPHKDFVEGAQKGARWLKMVRDGAVRATLIE